MRRVDIQAVKQRHHVPDMSGNVTVRPGRQELAPEVTSNDPVITGKIVGDRTPRCHRHRDPVEQEQRRTGTLHTMSENRHEVVTSKSVDRAPIKALRIGKNTSGRSR